MDIMDDIQSAWDEEYEVKRDGIFLILVVVVFEWCQEL